MLFPFIRGDTKNTLLQLSGQVPTKITLRLSNQFTAAIFSACLNQYHLWKKKVIWRNQTHFTFSNVSTDTAVIIKDCKLNENFMFHFKVTIRWNLTRSYATRLKSFKYKKHVIKMLCVFEEKFYLHMVRLLSGPFKHCTYYIF